MEEPASTRAIFHGLSAQAGHYMIEASAVGSLRSDQYAMGEYASRCPQIGFPKSLANLGAGRGDCERATLLDNSLGTEQPIKSGYCFHYVVAEPDEIGQLTSFAITADPVSPSTGVRQFLHRPNWGNPVDNQSARGRWKPGPAVKNTFGARRLR
jgi:hypothetical protein